MTPEQLAKSGTEHAHQRAFFAWCNMAQRFGLHAANDPLSYTVQLHAITTYGRQSAIHQLVDIHAIPNGGERNKIVAAKLKAEGVKPGIPDIHLPVACGGYHSLYIEMKKPGGRVSPEQTDRICRLKAYGNKVDVCFTWEEAVASLIQYLAV